MLSLSLSAHDPNWTPADTAGCVKVDHTTQPLADIVLTNPLSSDGARITQRGTMLPSGSCPKGQLSDSSPP
jgi:hypothetical protein